MTLNQLQRPTLMWEADDPPSQAAGPPPPTPASVDTSRPATTAVTRHRTATQARKLGGHFPDDSRGPVAGEGRGLRTRQPVSPKLDNHVTARRAGSHLSFRA
ncbi:hypothetical protein E2C01_040849 [Portunus trituberculatus]|uniref:Uncharacterized protein n=1 Tax=Portunus trituberculatus TaxID=210409 RepID=A0A5B7FRW4_PORTR|nr:hypothetical protein [Portunus trituberculatus]